MTGDKIIDYATATLGKGCLLFLYLRSDSSSGPPGLVPPDIRIRLMGDTDVLAKVCMCVSVMD